MVGGGGSAPAGEIGGRGLVLAAAPGDGIAPLRRVYARYLTHCCRRFLGLERELPAALRAAHASVAALVRRAVEARRGAMLSCFASPAVSTPLDCLDLLDELPRFRERIELGVMAMMPNLLLEMGLRELIPAGRSLLWEHGAPRLASMALGGELVAPAAATGLRFSASHLTAIDDGAELARLPLRREAVGAALADGSSGFQLQRCYRRIGKVAAFATIDHNPLAEFEAHPDKAGNHVDLGERSADEWVEVLDQCFALVERYLPGEFEEMGVLLRELVPVGYDPVRHLSASYREAVGTVYLTLHPNIMTMVEALVHEFQHNKLNVAAHGTEFIVNAFHPLYKSPVRPDPRPLWGILLAVHAFLPVAELYRQMRDDAHPLAARGEFDARLSDIDLKNHEGMEMLRAHASFTAAGQALFDDLQAIEARHMGERVARGLPTAPVAVHLG